ncbi:DUF3617 family protein [Sphingomonas sp. HF-S3]|uniref:DUF3617 family protein n=2 Tax=Sphingomonas rustica TaxID=3103142 RepID=A0ABV0BAE8_9SPHN
MAEYQAASTLRHGPGEFPAMAQSDPTQDAADAGPEISMTDASAEEVAKAAQAAGPKSRGGQWELTTEIVSAEIPGATPDIIAKMKEKGAISISQCFTDGELSAPIGKVDPSCKFAEFKMGRGWVNATTLCKMPQGEAIAKMKGTFADDRFDYEVQTTASMGEQSTKMTMKIAGHRAGDCTPAKKK